MSHLFQLLKQLEEKKKHLAIGLMSGTSLDGVDAVLVEISGFGTKTAIEQKEFITHPFPDGMNEMILRNAETNSGNVTEICKLNFLLSYIYVDAIKALCAKANVSLSDIDLVGSHGQTIHHLPQPEELFGFSLSSTLQIGDPAVIAKRTGILTVGDFRTGDVALGGQGAPLVPYFDFIMFHSNQHNRALLNIGGISNFTILNKNSDSKDVLAFDTGPGNMLIDYLVKKYFNKPYDNNGNIAASGDINESLLHELRNFDEFAKSKPPKSSGREYYGKTFLAKILELSKNLKPEDIIATVTTYTAKVIYDNYNNFVKHETEIDELYVSGGGAKNKTLLKYLQHYFGKDVTIATTKDLGLDPDAKEAVCFAVLAHEVLAGNPTNIPRVTGAEKQTIMGKICLG